MTFCFFACLFACVFCDLFIYWLLLLSLDIYVYEVYS